VRLAVFSPLPPSSSGIADYVAESLPALARRLDLEVVVEDPQAVDPSFSRSFTLRGASDPIAADLRLYHIGNSPAHGWIYRAACVEPGVTVLHDWSLHHLVLHETLERGDLREYLRQMRRSHGELGSFVGRQVARGLGGELLPARFAVNDRVLDACLGLVALTESLRIRAAERLPSDWPTLRLPHHVALPLEPLPSREQARAALGLPSDALIVTAPGLATAAKRLDVAVAAVARLRKRWPGLRLVVAGAVEPRVPVEAWGREAGLGEGLLVTGRLSLEDFIRHLCAADIVLALRFPSHGEISGALVRALGLGRVALVTGGTPAAEEFPEGVVVPVDPGTQELAHLEALLEALIRGPELRRSIEDAARDHARLYHDLDAGAARLARFLAEIHGRAPELRRRLLRDADEDPLLDYLLQETRYAAHDLGLGGTHLGVEPLLAELTRDPR
jgi:glycosyltransferase involved in cell wall biosynthesis